MYCITKTGFRNLEGVPYWYTVLGGPVGIFVFFLSLSLSLVLSLFLIPLIDDDAMILTFQRLRALEHI